MDNLKIEGITTVQGGTFDRVKVDGICTINGDLTAEWFDIDGVTTVAGSLTGGRLDCDGTATIKGNVDVQDFDTDGVTTIEGNLRAKRASVNGCVTVKGNSVEAEKIECNGYLKVTGELNAEVVEAEGYIDAREIVGERVIIRSDSNRFAKFLRRFKFKLGKFDFIEATQVDLTKVCAVTVHGHNVIIGKKCQIDNLDCSGTLSIDPSATVGAITGEYTLV